MEKNKSRKNLTILFLICSFAIVLNNIALETGDTTQTGRVSKLHCPKKGRCFWMTDVVPAELSLNVKMSIADILAGILASLLLVIGEDVALPYGYLPWLFLSFKSLIAMQGPSIIKFGYKALPMEKYSTIAFMIIATFLYAEEWSLWCDMLNSCRILWVSRKKELLKKAVHDKLCAGRNPIIDEKIPAAKSSA